VTGLDHVKAVGSISLAEDRLARLEAPLPEPSRESAKVWIVKREEDRDSLEQL
jgi:hypothetical protein